MVLTVTDANGCLGFAQFPEVITVLEKPVLNFVADVNAACSPPLSVNFTNQTVLNNATTPQYTWLFPGGTALGGGSQATGPTPPPVTYGAPGQFSVTLILASDEGCSDTLTIPSMIGIGGVTADFNAAPTTICQGQAITFNNLSQGGVTSYEWNFGETPGVNSTALNPVYSYNTPGIYTVTLRANNAACGDTIIRTNYITVDPTPVAAFSPDRTQDCQPGVPFVFANQSTGATSFQWDFGDGATSTQQNPQHSYATFGSFNICLIASNAIGCSDTVCTTVTIQAPSVNFTRDPTEGCAPMLVQFNGISNSIDPIVNWAWNFGAGATPATGVGQTPTATYGIPGTYNVSLTITTQSGCTATRTIASAVRVGTPPQVDFTASDDTVCLNDPVTFTSLFTNPSWDYYWDFQYIAPGNFSQLLDTATTMYPDTGLFSVALIIDDNGCRDTLIRSDLVYASPPRALFVLDQYLACELPAVISITDSSIGPADTYGWFLDGAFYSSLQSPPPININATGTYLLTQAVLNTLTGCADTFTTAFSVGNPMANFSLSTDTACRGQKVIFSGAGSTGLTSYRIYRNWINSPNIFYPQVQGSYIYKDTGSFTPALIVADQYGCEDSVILHDGITVVGPYPGFSATPVTGCSPLLTTFQDSSFTSSATSLVS
ncbi:MAG: PKD domain-containing protein, partial [Bacteroidia bacterium]|nr:PKD domain-containing protein [Bacteroidia bacterium]